MAIVFQSNTTASGTSGTACNKPAGSVSGDLLISQHLVVANNAAASSAGWTQIQSLPTASGTMSALYRVLDGSEGSSFAFTWASGTGYIGVTRMSGADTVSPINTSAKAANFSSSASPVTAPTVTTTVTNAYVMRVYVVSFSTSGTWSITGPDNNWQDSRLLNAGLIQAAAGAAGTQNASYSTGGGSAAGMTIAIAPAAVAKSFFFPTDTTYQILRGR